MAALLKLGVKGIISDRSDLLYAAVKAFDANGDGTPGDYIGSDGLIDRTKFDAEGHRGSRDLRPENTLPAMEAGLDNLVTTLETDNGITKDGKLVLFHDPYVEAAKCRRADGSPYTTADDVLIHDLTLAQIQSQFICDKTLRGPSQRNDRALSPVAVAFAKQAGLADAYTVPTTQNLFDFVRFYVDYYKSGPGKGAPDAERRWKNAERVHFNIETKLNPRTDTDPAGNVFAERTAGPGQFARTLAGEIERNGLQDRADVQSFDFRTLLAVQKEFPEIQTVYLFGDFPKYADPTIEGSDDGTNLQPQGGDNTPWMAGVRWPYRVTAQANPFRAQTSGGFEGMALTPDGKTLLPLLEKPLAGDTAGTLRINAFDLASRRYTGVRYAYALDARGTNIGDFIMFDATHGLVLERDPSQGDLGGYKAVQEITLRGPEQPVGKSLLVDLLNVADPDGISTRGAQPGDVGLGTRFAFPYTTIEDVVVLDRRHIGILNDNNFPFSLGRHLGTKALDDNEFIVLRLGRKLG
jgi:glycerophosphoryl diester phosphodiesterase